jgi:hypothetical protein
MREAVRWRREKVYFSSVFILKEVMENREILGEWKVFGGINEGARCDALFRDFFSSFYKYSLRAIKFQLGIMIFYLSA